MLKELKLINYRGFHDHTISFSDLNVIVGSNNAGKSTVVEALRVISIITNRYKGLPYRKVPNWLDISGSSYGVTPSLRFSEINFDSICHQYHNETPAIIEAIFTDDSSVTVYLNNKGNIHGVITLSDGKVINSKSISYKADLPQINILPQVAPLQRDETILDPDYVNSAIGSTLSPLHFRNQLNIFFDLIPEFQRAVEESWPAVRINKLHGINGLPGTFLSLEVRNETFVSEVSLMGHGLQMWLQVIWFLTLNKNSSIIILDEPDVYMHADLQRRLIRLIKNQYPQVIITTHSVEIMSEVSPEEILIIDKSTDKSKFADVIPAVQELITKTGSIHNVGLSRLWSSNKFIIVEGKDLKYLKTLQNKLFPYSILPIDSIPNFSMGGWGGWNYAVGSKLLLFNNFGQQIKIFCIFDSDYHTPKEIKVRYDDAKSKNILLHVWSKKEIENFFIIPAAISRFIKNNFDTFPSVKDVENQLLIILKKEKENLLDKLSDEYSKSEKGKSPGYFNRIARKVISEKKSVEGNILSLVSGKEIFSALSEWSQQTYSVSFNAFSILTEIKKSEIHPELKRILACIEFGRSF